ncbi:S8 family serine peptidase [Flavobacterium sp.]|uniref:S8 family peptidase n=1 Tax=Flavobacterium sp. TaxID=239 RepID=UPI0011F5D6C3|nr:S8 family serine peptidase [Flavobacterium sp.]RZJ73070.1 MAG: hypothetical protein EOO49_05415 [Flavobacterium sp.]
MNSYNPMAIRLAIVLWFGLFFISCKNEKNEKNESGSEVFPEEKFVQSIPDEFILRYTDKVVDSMDTNKANFDGTERAGTNKRAVANKLATELRKLDSKATVLGFTERFALIKTGLGKNALSSLLGSSRIQSVQQNYVIKFKFEEIRKFTGSTKEHIPWNILRVGGGRYSVINARAWVLDTGVDQTHKDINYDVSYSASFVPGEVAGRDSKGHGTHIAGIIGARANGEGVVGVAPNVRISSVKVIDKDGSLNYGRYLQALDYVALHAESGDVVNLSFVSNQIEPNAIELELLELIVGKASIVIAAGNATNNTNGVRQDINDVPKVFPAAYNMQGVYTVSACDKNDQLASFSNYGLGVDYAEPGVEILSTVPGGYGYDSGTSMAAPHLVGLLLKGNVKSNSFLKSDLDGQPDPIGTN